MECAANQAVDIKAKEGEEQKLGPANKATAAKKGKGESQVLNLTSNCEASKILGAVTSPAGVMFLVEWKGSKRSDLLLAEHVKKKWPQVVIEFYEKNITWQN